MRHEHTPDWSTATHDESLSEWKGTVIGKDGKTKKRGHKITQGWKARCGTCGQGMTFQVALQGGGGRPEPLDPKTRKELKERQERLPLDDKPCAT